LAFDRILRDAPAVTIQERETVFGLSHSVVSGEAVPLVASARSVLVEIT
jgi:hypothetical protein